MRLKLKSWNFSLVFLLCTFNQLNAQSITLTSAAGTDSQTVCQNSAITNIEYTVGDGATDAAISVGNLPVGVTGVFNAGVFTISGVPTDGVAASYTYSVTTIGGANSAAIISGVINVNSFVNVAPLTSTASTGCLGNSISVSTTTSNVQYSSSNPSIATVSSTGIVTLVSAGTLTITCGPMTGCGTAATTAITVNPNPTITGALAICVGGTTTLVGSGTPSANSWSSNIWGVAPIDINGEVTGASAGTSIISYVDINGCIATAFLTVNFTPTITFTGNTSVCEGGNLLITPSTAPVMSTYNWTGPNNFAATSSNLSITNIQAAMAGTYICTAVTTNGCVNSESIDIVVNSTMVTPTFVYEDTVCQGSAPFQLPTISNDNAPISGTISPAFVATNTVGTTTYTFTPNAGECATSTTLDITVIQCPGITATVTPTSVSANGICDGTASIEITSGSAPFNYLFSDAQTQVPATGLCEGLQTVTISDANGDTLVLNFLVPSPSNTTTTDNYLDSTLVDTVYNPAVTNCIVNYLQIDSAQINNFTILPNDSVSVTWTVFSGDSITTITDIYVLGSSAGIYMIALQIYCPQKSLGEFLVAYDQLYYNPAMVTITDNNSYQISVAPNPFNDHLEIILDNDESSEIIIHDIIGQVVFSNHYHSQTINLDLQSLSAGQYILTIINGKTIVTKNLVK